MSIFYFFKGRVGLYALLKAMEIMPDDEVILPGFTCVVVPNAISYCGAKPVYVDIKTETYNIDPDKIEKSITKKTKAIIAQHTFGVPAKMNEIIKIAKKYNLFVIEDSAHALGSKYYGNEVGSLGDAAFFSSQWSKPLTTGLGGWVNINNDEISMKVDQIVKTFIKPSKKEEMSLSLQYFLYSNFISPSIYLKARKLYSFMYKSGILTGSSSSDELSCKMPVDYTKLMSNWQYKKLQKSFEEKEKLITYRKWVANQYFKYLPSQYFGSYLLKKEDFENLDISFLRVPILVKDKETVLKKAIQQGLEIGDWFVSPVHPNLSNWELAGYKKGTCPEAEKVCKHIVNLPTHDKIDQKTIKKIVSFILRFAPLN